MSVHMNRHGLTICFYKKQREMANPDIDVPNPSSPYLCTEEQYQSLAQGLRCQQQWESILSNVDDQAWLSKLDAGLVSQVSVLTAHIVKDLENETLDAVNENSEVCRPFFCAKTKPVWQPLGSVHL
jgi:hypothetical protein